MASPLAHASGPVVEPFSPGLRRAVGVVMVGATLPFLDSTIVNLALQSLSKSLHAPLVQVQWVGTAYLLALAASRSAWPWAPLLREPGCSSPLGSSKAPEAGRSCRWAR